MTHERGASKGSAWTDRKGYVRLYVTKGRWVYEHRDVMARVLGRPLLRTEHVHHINGDRADNRPENLELHTASTHAAYHNHDAPKRKPKRGWAVTSLVTTAQKSPHAADFMGEVTAYLARTCGASSK